MTTTDWQDSAACTQTDPEVFFNDSREHTADRAAIAVCGRCLVQPACLRWALAEDIQYGIWGGMTERERAKVLGRAVA